MYFLPTINIYITCTLVKKRVRLSFFIAWEFEVISAVLVLWILTIRNHIKLRSTIENHSNYFRLFVIINAVYVHQNQTLHADVSKLSTLCSHKYVPNCIFTALITHKNLVSVPGFVSYSLRWLAEKDFNGWWNAGLRLCCSKRHVSGLLSFQIFGLSFRSLIMHYHVIIISLS